MADLHKVLVVKRMVYDILVFYGDTSAGLTTTDHLRDLVEAELDVYGIPLEAYELNDEAFLDRYSPAG